MGCCGKKIKESIQIYDPKPVKNKNSVRKIKNIVSGNWTLIANELKQIPKDKCNKYNARLSMCRRCENHTWLTWSEFFRYINDNGGLVRFVKQIAYLEDWPLLSKQDYKSKRKMFCRVCKCFLKAKAASRDEVCPLDKWKNLNDIKESL